MIASDLRIGNWVQRIGWHYQIVGIKGIDIWIDAKGVEFMFKLNDGFHPITLTEEWLEKFGLIHELSIYDDYWYLLGSDWFGIEFDEESNNWFCILLSGKRSIAEFKYVHQLQNLYHALTGEEL
jgi:hypothetical protein